MVKFEVDRSISNHSFCAHSCVRLSIISSFNPKPVEFKDPPLVWNGLQTALL